MATLPARGLSQYARNVRKFVGMRRLVAISLPWTYINCWSELGVTWPILRPLADHVNLTGRLVHAAVGAVGTLAR